MERSLFLAKLIGPLFLTIALGLLLNQDTYWGIINEVIRHPTPVGSMLIYLSGLLSMLAGLAIVNAHSVWVRDWRVLITILGWLMLIAGVVRIASPDIGLKIGSVLYASSTTCLLLLLSPSGSAVFSRSRAIRPKGEIPRDGSLTPFDVAGKLDVLRGERRKCGRAGRYPVAASSKSAGARSADSRLAR
jgi:hypothetical protein